MSRSPALQHFLDESMAALRASTTGEAAAAAGRVAERLAQAGTPQGVTATRLPVCDWIAPALQAAQDGPRQALAQAFGALEGQLNWQRRRTARPEDAAFWNGHGNAMILGPGGLEQREDLWIGVTVMAPGTVYQDHDHPPEEVYLSLAPGEWWNARMDWTDPGAQGAIYNPPGIRHAMRAGATPFLALWYLPA
ncbi:MAG: dimethylsulfonioproprionate lyase family protein [Paracoccaceae bacterium]